ncbi:MAG: dihydropteroate synthase [Candidatus Competibacterales bacterium]
MTTEVYLGLGSNQGDRRDYLRRALAALREAGVQLQAVSPPLETPAAIPPTAPSPWHRPFLNLVAKGRVDTSPGALLAGIEAIHTDLGRADRRPGAPRPVDIDILLWGDERYQSPELTIPHPRMHQRSFVLAPLVLLEPSLVIPGQPSGRTVLEWCRRLPHYPPWWMGIVNITPDSFSDGTKDFAWQAMAPRIEAMVAAGVHIVDLGAESTRPGAEALTAAEEWQRLAPVLEPLLDHYRHDWARPWFSVDTYHPETAARALALGVDIINDVSGLTRAPMVELAAGSKAQWVAMHHLSLPAHRQVTLPEDQDPVDAIEQWLEQRLEAWEAAGLDYDRVIVDPGLGFGKTPFQSLTLLRELERLKTAYGLRLLIGHSRKSLITVFSDAPPPERDLETLGLSLALGTQGVEILRVHDVAAHVRVHRAFAHALPADPR